MINGKDLGRPANACLVTAGGTIHATGKIVAYCPTPMVCIRTEKGEELWWNADLCEVIIPDQPSKDQALMQPGRDST
jgi:hypothetical protein